jgi:hypothetical protein
MCVALCRRQRLLIRSNPVRGYIVPRPGPNAHRSVDPPNPEVPAPLQNFPDAKLVSCVDAARDWYRSLAYQNANRHQHLGADYAAVILEGSKPPSAPSISE